MENLVNKDDKECIELLLKIFDNYEILLQSIVPNGWKESDFVKFLHPTAEQQFEEHVRISENLNKLTKKSKRENKSLKTIKDFTQDNLKDVNEFDEFIYILGLAVYDIFSNNHEVIGSDTKIYDLGSMRGSGGFIADFINMHHPLSYRLDYIDFYMGSIWIKDRSDLYPFYFHIFKTLKENKCNWNYSFPRMYLIDLKETENEETDNHSEYRPENAIEKQLEKDNDEITKFKQDLDKIYEDEYEEAKYKPLTSLVKAYKDVYSVLPNGHPQKEFE